MIRIAIGTLALTMLAAPMIAMSSGPAPEQPAAVEQMAASLSQDEILVLAREQGMARLSDISFQDNVWTVTGETRGGFAVTVRITAQGEVLTHTS